MEISKCACGGEAEWFAHTGYKAYAVECPDGCQTQGPVKETADAAIEAWNTMQSLVRKGKLFDEAVAVLKQWLENYNWGESLLGAARDSEGFLEKVKEL